MAHVKSNWTSRRTSRRRQSNALGAWPLVAGAPRRAHPRSRRATRNSARQSLASGCAPMSSPRLCRVGCSSSRAATRIGTSGGGSARPTYPTAGPGLPALIPSATGGAAGGAKQGAQSARPQPAPVVAPRASSDAPAAPVAPCVPRRAAAPLPHSPAIGWQWGCSASPAQAHCLRLRADCRRLFPGRRGDGTGGLEARRSSTATAAVASLVWLASFAWLFACGRGGGAVTRLSLRVRCDDRKSCVVKRMLLLNFLRIVWGA